MNDALVEPDCQCSEWTSRYEQLRSTALPGYQTNSGNWGMALFIRQGMVGWMRAWPKGNPPLNILTYQPTTVTIPQTSIPSSLQNQVTMLLANMILNCQREVAL